MADPLVRDPETFVQYVDVPFVASTCPAVPVALLESRNPPDTEILFTETSPEKVVELLKTVLPENTALLKLAFERYIFVDVP